MLTHNLSKKYEFIRKFIHLLSLIYPLIYFLTDFYIFIYIIFLSCLSIISIDIARKRINVIKLFFSKSFNFVIREYEYNSFMGATYMLISFLLITLLFDKNIVIISMIILIISDTIAAIYGIKYGKIYLAYMISIINKKIKI